MVVIEIIIIIIIIIVMWRKIIYLKNPTEEERHPTRKTRNILVNIVVSGSGLNQLNSNRRDFPNIDFAAKKPVRPVSTYLFVTI